MKAAEWIGNVVLALVLFAGAWFIVNLDVVTSHYATLAEARADQLFDRGWLPDILPPSATRIRTANDLDLNTSEGEFHFSRSEYGQLLTHLRPYEPRQEPFAISDKEVARMRRRGFEVNAYVDEESTWVFFCKPEREYCEYYMWFRRFYGIDGVPTG